MIRVHRLTASAGIRVFGRDHYPPHFHTIASDEPDVLINIQILEIIAGMCKRKHLKAGLAWAADPVNRATLMVEWRRQNDPG